MSETVEQLLARLRAEYLAEAPAKLAEIENAVSNYEPANQESAVRLARLLHRLAGSAGAYGFKEVTKLCREAEESLGREPRPTRETMAGVVVAVRETLA